MIINMSRTKDNKDQFVRCALYPEMQHEENAKTTTLFVPKDFDVNAKHMQEECEPKEFLKTWRRGPFLEKIYHFRFFFQNVSTDFYACKIFDVKVYTDLVKHDEMFLFYYCPSLSHSNP